MKKVVFIIIIFIICIILSGCWDYREMRELGIVSAIAIDKADEADKILVTAQIINANNISQPGSTGSGEKAYFNINATEDTIYKALRQITHKIDRKIYASHMKVLIINKSMAREGILEYIDFFIRDPEPRNNIYLLVSEGKAADILNIEPDIEKINGNYINNMIKSNFAVSQSADINLQEFLQNLISENTSSVTPLIRIEENKLVLGGGAIFKENKYVGSLNEKEARGLLWILDRVKSGILINKGFEEGDKISFETIRVSSNIDPVIKDNEIIINIEIYNKSEIGETTGCVNLYSDLQLSAMKKRNATVINNEIKAVIKKAKELNTDIFGFGEMIYKKYPDEWYKIRDNWDLLFPELKSNILVESDIKLSGMVVKCLKNR